MIETITVDDKIIRINFSIIEERLANHVVMETSISISGPSRIEYILGVDCRDNSFCSGTLILAT